MKPLSSLVFLALLAGVVHAQSGAYIDPYTADDPDVQQSIHARNMALGLAEEEFDPALEDLERIDTDLRAAIRAAQDDADEVGEFTARMASAEKGGFLAGILGGLDITTLLLILMGGGGVAGGLVANKKRKAAELGKAVAEKGKEQAEKLIHRPAPAPAPGGTNGKRPGYSIPEHLNTGEHTVPDAVESRS